MHRRPLSCTAQASRRAAVNAERSAESGNAEKAIVEYFAATGSAARALLQQVGQMKRSSSLGKHDAQPASDGKAKTGGITMGEFQALAAWADNGNQDDCEAAREVHVELRRPSWSSRPEGKSAPHAAFATTYLEDWGPK